MNLKIVLCIVIQVSGTLSFVNGAVVGQRFQLKLNFLKYFVYIDAKKLKKKIQKESKKKKKNLIETDCCLWAKNYSYLSCGL